MQTLKVLTKSSVFGAIAMIGLLGCNQPSSTQANASNPNPVVTQNSGTQIAQAADADDVADRVDEALDDHPT